MNGTRLVALVVLAVCVPATSFADSDGYFCKGKTYLAYQFGMAPMPVAPHRLYIISIRGPQGIPEPVSLELPQFQVHGMLCGDGWVDIASFTVVYRVLLDENSRPLRYERQRSLVGQPIPKEFISSQSQNLGALAGGRAYPRPVRTILGPKTVGGEYILEVVAKAIEPLNRCEIAITSRVIETNSSAQEIGERVIFQGRGHRECGGGSR